eukprot:2515192-Pleurochrysis_carterae.AAC.1
MDTPDRSRARNSVCETTVSDSMMNRGAPRWPGHPNQHHRKGGKGDPGHSICQCVARASHLDFAQHGS